MRNEHISFSFPQYEEVDTTLMSVEVQPEIH